MKSNFETMNTMKAIVCLKYGSPEVLQLKDVEKPVPKDNELLIKIFAVTVGVEDPMQRKGKPYFARLFVGLTKPRKPILGTEFSGEIEETGKNVTLFKKGDRVFGVTGAHFGCYAQYVCMPETGFVSITPPNMTNEEAAPVCGALAAWDFLKEIADVQSGKKVLIYGASGNIGLAAVQISKLFGAEVTGVCSSSNFEMVKSLGANNVMDISNGNFINNGMTYDVILDVTGKPSSLPFKKILNSRGFYMTAYPTVSILFQTVWTSIFNGKRVVFSATGLKPVSVRLGFLKELIMLFSEGKLKKVIDKNFPLEQMIEAHRYIELGLERGNVVVTV